MGRCNNRRTREAAQNARNTPARARFSAPPPSSRRPKRTAGGRGHGNNTNNSSSANTNNNRSTVRNRPAAVVAKITRRVTSSTTGQQQHRTSRDPLRGVDIGKLPRLTLPTESILKIRQLLTDLGVVHNKDDEEFAEEDSQFEASDHDPNWGRDDATGESTDNVGRELNVDQEEEDYVTSSVDVGPLHDDTQWEGTPSQRNKLTDEKDWSADPTFRHVTQHFSFRPADAARACRAVTTWKVSPQAEETNGGDDEKKKPTSKLVDVLDWLCLHLDEAALTAGFRHSPHSAPITNRVETRIKPVPHPSISVVSRAEFGPEWRRQMRLEERAVGFLKLGFDHGSILQVLQETDPEGENGATDALADWKSLVGLLVRVEQEVSSASELEDGTEVVADEHVLAELEMEQEALAAIYGDDGFKILGHWKPEAAVYEMTLDLDDIDGTTCLLVFVEPGYPGHAVPHILLRNHNLPWGFLRKVNTAIIENIVNIGKGVPVIFDVVTFLSETLSTLLADFEKSQRQLKFDQEQARVREEAGHSSQEVGGVPLGRRQQARMKQAERAYKSPDDISREESERKQKQQDRIERTQHEDANIRQTMADVVVNKRAEDRHAEEVRKLGRAAMLAVFNANGSTEDAKAAKELAENAYKRENGLLATDDPQKDGEGTVEQSVSRQDEVGESEEDIDTPSTPMSQHFFEKLRALYSSATQGGSLVPDLSEPSITDVANPLEHLPKPMAARTDDMNSLRSEIVQVQAQQPWLIAGEARIPCSDRDGTKPDPQVQEVVNQQLRQRLISRQKSRQSQTIFEQRRRLPAYTMRQQIVKLIYDNQVTLVVGSTGCGKTTQVPQLVLSDMISANRGSEANIIVTQPRRISAIGVANRIAAELGEKVGDTCGYSIKLERKSSKNTRLLLCTTGILLRRLQIDPDLASVSHVFIDEVHERDMLTDFLLIVLRNLALRRKNLNIVLMSATVSAKTFSDYFEGCETIEIPGRTFPVEVRLLEDVLQLTGYEVKEGSDYAMDERRKAKMNGPSKAVLLQKYGGSYDRHVINSLSIVDEAVINYELMASLLEHITVNCEEGAILVFLPGMAEITNAIDEMRRKEIFQGDSVVIYPLHSSLSGDEQSRVFEVPPSGVRKIVVSTNIAETSITIEDVVYVVDSGRVKENRRDEVKETPALIECWVSRSSAKQRRGRSGRVRAGVAFHLFSSHTNDEQLQDYTLPEILRVGVEDLVLQILVLDLGEPHHFLGMAIDRPSGLAAKNALVLLEELGAVECKWLNPGHVPQYCSELEVKIELTAMGFHLATLPVAPRVGKILIYGAIFGCTDGALTLAASMSCKNLFASSFENRDAVDSARQALAVEHSDHLTVLAAFNEWRNLRATKGNIKAQRFMRDNHINRNALFQLNELRKQYSKLLIQIGFLPKSYKLPQTMTLRADDVPLIKAILCAGFYPNIILAPRVLLGSDCKVQAGELSFQSRRKGDVYLHPSTLSSSQKRLGSRYCCYHEIVKTSKLYIRDCTTVSPFSILLFGGVLEIHHAKEVVTIDQWLRFRLSRSPASLIKHLRIQLEKMLLENIINPSVDMGMSESGLLGAVRTLLGSEQNPNSHRNDGASIVRPFHG